MPVDDIPGPVRGACPVAGARVLGIAAAGGRRFEHLRRDREGQVAAREERHEHPRPKRDCKLPGPNPPRLKRCGEQE